MGECRVTYITKETLGVKRQEDEVRVTRGYIVRAYGLETVDTIEDADTIYEREYDYAEIGGWLSDTIVPNKKFAVQSQLNNMYYDMIAGYEELAGFENYVIYKVGTEGAVSENGNEAVDVAMTIEAWDNAESVRTQVTKYYRVEIIED